MRRSRVPLSRPAPTTMGVAYPAPACAPFSVWRMTLTGTGFSSPTGKPLALGLARWRVYLLSMNAQVSPFSTTVAWRESANEVCCACGKWAPRIRKVGTCRRPLRAALADSSRPVITPSSNCTPSLSWFPDLRVLAQPRPVLGCSPIAWRVLPAVPGDGTGNLLEEPWRHDRLQQHRTVGETTDESPDGKRPPAASPRCKMMPVRYPYAPLHAAEGR